MTILDQYRSAKARHPGMMLLLRAVDYFELIGEAAEEAAKICGLTLTTKDGQPMCGCPHHCLEQYLRQLFKNGVRVAVCEWTDEAPKTTQTHRVGVPGLFDGIT